MPALLQQRGQAHRQLLGLLAGRHRQQRPAFATLYAWDYNGGLQAYSLASTPRRGGCRLPDHATMLYPYFWRNVTGIGPDYTRGQWNRLTIEYDGMDSIRSTDRLEMYVNGVTVQAACCLAERFGPAISQGGRWRTLRSPAERKRGGRAA